MPPAPDAASAEQDRSPSGLHPRLSSVVAMCFLAVAAIVLAYVGGVMSGRAYAVRHASPIGSVRQAPAGEGAAAPAAGPGVVGGEDAQDSADAGQQILAPEELRFARALRNGTSMASMSEQARPTPSAPPAVAPAAIAANAVEPAAGPSTSPFAPAVPEGQTPAPAPEATLFDYVFQVGAFKDADSVDSLRQRLEGRGLRTRMERDGKLYLVQVLLRGDAARAAEVSKITEEMRLGPPIVRSRKPAAP